MLVTYYMDYMAYMLLTKCEVKMAGYWQCSFFAFLRTEKNEVHKDAQEVWGLYPAILTNQVRLQVFFDAQDQNGQSQGSKITPSGPLG